MSCGEFHTARSITRRRALQAGSLASLSLGLSDLLLGQRHARSLADALNTTPAAGFGRAKRCILLFMWGGPSQLDTWDPKPHAPDEIRGDFKPIATSVPGTFISEHFPQLAKHAHEYAIIRSMTHNDKAHLSSAHHLLTGSYAPRRFSDADPPSPKDTPHIGSIMARLHPTQGGVPPFVMMPWVVSHPAAPGGRAPGQHGGWLGRGFDPLLVGDANDPNFKVPGCVLPADIPTDRLISRQDLLAALGSSPLAEVGPDWSDCQKRAISLLMSESARRAFDLSHEPAAVRDRYGRNTHGQCVLLARRLLEAEVPLVTVNWHDDRSNFWDTHGQNFTRLKGELMPPTDAAFSALLTDLSDRGMLDETLVVWVGEFGRRPVISRDVAGREHWPGCYSAVLAGGGIRGGAIYGASDRIAASPSEKPTSPSDLVATIYHALGIPPELTLADSQNVPKHIVQGMPITALFG